MDCAKKMIYTLEESKHIFIPIAINFNVKAAWIFGSYACNEPSEESDVDILMDFKDSKVKTLFDFADIHENIEKKLEKKSI